MGLEFEVKGQGSYPVDLGDYQQQLITLHQCLSCHLACKQKFNIAESLLKDAQHL